MALTVGSLVVKLSADTGGFFTGIGNVMKGMEQFAKKSKEMAGNVAASGAALTAATAAATALAATVDGRTAVAVEELRKKTGHFAVQVADVLAPAMKEMGALFTRAADFVAGLSPHLKAQLAHWAVLGTQVAFGAKAFQLLMGVVAPLTGALGSTLPLVGKLSQGMLAFGAAANLGINTGLASLAKVPAALKAASAAYDVGFAAPMAAAAKGIGPAFARGFSSLATTVAAVLAPVAGLLAVLVGVTATVVILHRAWRKNWGGIQDITESVVKWIGGAFEQLGGVLRTVSLMMFTPIIIALKSFIFVIDEINKGLLAMGKQPMMDTSGLKFALEGLAKDAASGGALKAAWDFGKKVGAEVKDATMEELDGLPGMVKSLLDKIGFGGGGGGKARAEQEFQDIFRDFKASAADAFVYAIKEGGQELKKLAASLWDTFQRNPIAMGRQQRQAAYTQARQEYDQGQVGVGEPTWDLALKALDAASKDGASFADQAGLWFKRMAAILGSGLEKALGEVGGLINSAIQGATAGGVWGAITAVFLDLLAKAESVKRFASAALDAVGQIVAALEPVVAPIMDALINVLKPIVEIFRVVFDALGPFFRMIGSLINSLVPILKMIGTIMKYLAPILQVIFVAIGTVVAIIMSIIMPIVAAIQEIGGNHEGAAQTMRSLDELWTAVGTPMVNSANGAATALDGTAAAAQAVTESLLNVPEGYKVNQARFQAAIAEGDYTMPGSSTPGMPGPSGPSVYTPPPITFNGDLVVQAQDPEDLLAQLHARVVRINGQRYGTPVGAP